MYIHVHMGENLLTNLKVNIIHECSIESSTSTLPALHISTVTVVAVFIGCFFMSLLLILYRFINLRI